ncbi:MAG: septum formation initiator family protein [Firmicutes bacterium]|nr:septum formation initiator family protein [Bacillota bacterium]
MKIKKVITLKIKKKQSPKFFYFLLLILIILSVFFYFYREKHLEYLKKKASVARLESEINNLKKTNAELKNQIERLNKPVGAEEIARDRLGMTKPGELSFVIIPSPEETPAPEAAKQPAANDKKENWFSNLIKKIKGIWGND